MYMLYKFDKHLGSTRSSFINILSASTPQNVDFAHCVPILKLRTTSLTFQLYRSLQWANFTMEFMSKFNILLSWVKKMFIYIHKQLYILVLSNCTRLWLPTIRLKYSIFEPCLCCFVVRRHTYSYLLSLIIILWLWSLNKNHVAHVCNLKLKKN